jgi:N4-gp56 family major capsid protein
MSEIKYNDPAGGTPSTIGPQIRTDYYQKKALIEAKKTQFFTQLADVTAMPKHFGKTIKRYHYLPLLDDANINDQGIDAAGLSTNQQKTIIITEPDVTSTGNGWVSMYAVGNGADEGTATTAAESAANDIWKNLGVFDTDYATTKAALEALTPPWTIDDTIPSVPTGGNIYGSSKDVGTIASKLPSLSETGGRVNRVGFKRIELEGTIEKFGFFDEYTQESLDFDTDDELMMHINRELLNGASEMTEDALQIDLLNAPGVIRYGGDASSDGELTGNNGATPSVINYNDFMRLAIELDNNRTPKNTTIITGSRMIDTKTVSAARYMYVGTELIPMLKNMVDNFDNPAFIDIKQYGAAGTIATGEIGSIDQFRIIVVPEMMHWAGTGAAVTTNDGYYEQDGAYDVFPMLVVGDGSFTTIGFQTDGKTTKFKITHKKPGRETANHNDPYGEVGFMSIKWYYGSMILRPERIALMKTVAQW